MATWDTWKGDSWIDAETNQRFMYDPEQQRVRSVDEYNGERQKAAEGLEKTNAYFSSNPQAFQKLTPEQTDYIKNFHGSADELTKYYGSINPNLSNLYGNGLASNGADMWWTPQEGPKHTDNGGPLSAGSLLTGGLDVGEQGQSDWNDMRTGLGIMALPFVGAGITAGVGAGAAAGGAAVGGTETGITAGAAGSGFGATGAAAGEGTIAGGAGSTTVAGGAGADTLGGETLFPGESATSGSAGSNGGGMWDFVDNVGYDPGAEGTYNAPVSDGGAFDMGGSQGVFDSQGNPTYQSPSILDYLKSYGQQGMDSLEGLKQYGSKGMAIYNALKGLTGGVGGGKSTGGGILGGIFNDPLGSAFNASPFLLAMAEANRQGNKTDPILAKLSGLADQAGSNEGGLLSSVTGPYNRQTMAGRDSLMADQSLRGIRGSSFGDQGITSYDTTRSQGLGELTGSTQAKSIGLQGGLLNQLLAGQTQAATSRNLLLGAGLNASGKLFQPQSDPFGLKNLLGV